MADLKKTQTTRMKRLKDRGRYDRDTINNVLDGGFLCHVAYQIDGRPLCTPTLYWRSGNHVYWHGSRQSRFLKQVVGKSACLTVTHVDGIVLARSAFNHSMNYRSVMLFGQAELVEEPDKSIQLRALVDHLIPGRWETLRPMSRKEINATTVLRMAIEEGSAKVRAGNPSDNKEDYALPIWAGTIPLHVASGTPVPDPANAGALEVPRHVREYRLPGGRQ
jgi:nitroimidazol reductase NimA-like FMN-containing flavoprotein (pyridoxamine 5'-phosphate oxidase superfamily)